MDKLWKFFIIMLLYRDFQLKKFFKGSLKQYEKNNLFLKSCKKGVIKIKTVQPARVNFKQILVCFQTLNKKIKKSGKLKLKLFFNLQVTKKVSETRMGKGKGFNSHFACKILPGEFLFEIFGTFLTKIELNFFSMLKKLPVKTKTIT